ncbi:flagellar biosynthetic protein FliO [Paenibacillus roseipurpureus]|uniref:Flagellar biosynthetic protein FliO n=1 Tax=Paenibacillus roseopurpureus TaxID=2918901 RepID=A0AA96RMN7_9BACL|nr:flagellar biosynthetic protein FliO [Paenibacillus sp. MBLB1832]WNR46656.1 flagellar biosynthetic protein FliO [Paenibacillus sp. MBLB1832]
MKRRQSKLVIGALSLYSLLATTQFVHADTDSSTDSTIVDYPGSTSSMDSFFMVAKVISVLVLIIGLFLVLMRYLAKKNKGSLFGNSIRSIGGVPLGPNKSIQIVEIGHSLFVVGVGENIQLLDKIIDADEVAYITELLQSSQDERMGIASLSKWISKLPSRKTVVEEEVELTSSFQQVFHDKLKRVTDRNKNVEEWLSDQKQKDRLNEE